jgi:hypothetical protein
MNLFNYLLIHSAIYSSKNLEVAVRGQTKQAQKNTEQRRRSRQQLGLRPERFAMSGDSDRGQRRVHFMFSNFIGPL